VLCLPREKVSGKDGIGLTMDDLDPALRRFLGKSKTPEEIIRIGSRVFLCRKTPLPDAPDSDETLLICRDVTEIQQQERKIRLELHAKGFTAKFLFEDIVGKNAALKPLIAKARTFAATDANILIQGESGTGKELFAQSIHNASVRKNGPFVAVNCAAIPKTLLESELFGYEEGAFSGARRSGKPGLFELAHEGTIFLDEINSLPIDLQGVLLRVIQERQVRKVGSQSLISIDTRIISATNSDIERLIAENAFRSDLYYRLNTLNLGLPPLRDRREDIPILARHFLAMYAARYKTPVPAMSERDMGLLLAHVWSGNVRELENVIHRHVVLNQTGNTGSLASCLDAAAAPAGLPRGASDSLTVRRGPLARIEHEIILRYLEESRWNKRAAADRLGVSRATLWRKLKATAF
jgi:transcriptional regulator with PAS, ATPase and Fis domain